MSITKSQTMPYPLYNDCCGNALPVRCGANYLADYMRASPRYRQQETERWDQAITSYQEMIHKRDQCCTSPPNSPIVQHPLRRKSSQSGTSSPAGSNGEKSHSGSLMGSFPSLTKVSSKNRSLHGTNPQSRGDTSLELEAVAAVHEFSIAVQTISVSEILPRTPELIFVNVTTFEGYPYCLELTTKGWRVTSLRHDCMQGDYRRMELFTTYYDSLNDLMDNVSPGYRDVFNQKLTQKLEVLQLDDDADLPAPTSSSPTVTTPSYDENSDSDQSAPESSQMKYNTKKSHYFHGNY